MPGEYLTWIAQTIGIEALVGLILAAGEAHITFSVIAHLRSGLYRANRVQDCSP